MGQTAFPNRGQILPGTVTVIDQTAILQIIEEKNLIGRSEPEDIISKSLPTNLFFDESGLLFD